MILPFLISSSSLFTTSSTKINLNKYKVSNFYAKKYIQFNLWWIKYEHAKKLGIIVGEGKWVPSHNTIQTIPCLMQVVQNVNIQCPRFRPTLGSTSHKPLFSYKALSFNLTNPTHFKQFQMQPIPLPIAHENLVLKSFV